MAQSIPEIYGSLVFNDKIMREKLPKDMYQALKKTIENGTHLELDVAELSKLNELNDTIKSMGGEVVGVNTDTFDGKEATIKEAKKILESQGAKYRNFALDANSDAGKYASEIMAFPTTILVDRKGNIVGEPMVGGIDNQENYDTLMKQIKSVIEADSANK